MNIYRFSYYSYENSQKTLLSLNTVFQDDELDSVVGLVHL